MYVCTSSSLSIPLLMNRLRPYTGYCRYSCSEHWVACIFSNYGFFQIYFSRASLVAQLVKNPPAMQENQFDSWVWKIPWRRDILPTPVFLGFPCGSAGKESPCNAGDLGMIPGWEDPLENGTATHSSILAGRFPWTVQSMVLQRVGHY